MTVTDELVVGITGINASDNPMPGIGVARSLKEDKELKVRIAGLAHDAMESGIYLDRFIDKSFLLPYPSLGSESFMARLLSIKQDFGLDVIIPTLDSELPFFMRYRDELAAHGVKTFLPSREQFHSRNKEKLGALAERSGLLAPRQAMVRSFDELAEAVREIGLPVMVKGLLYKARLAHTLEEAVACLRGIVIEWGYPVIVQEVITGEEMNVIGVGDGAGALMGRVAIKKMTVTELGKIRTSVTIRHCELLEAARRFVANTSWRGAFEMEFMVDGEKVYLIEINPRFPAWVYFATGVGVNLPAMLVRHALGEKVEAARDYEAGMLYIRFTEELVRDMGRFRKLAIHGES